MRDTFIYDQLRRFEEQRRREQPQLQLELELPFPVAPAEPPEEERGVWTIELL